MTLLVQLCFVLAMLPALMLVTNLPLYRAPRRLAAHCSGPPPRVSVLVPARNEEDNIEGLVRSVLASRDVELELVVLDDQSTDRTRDILDRVGDPRLRVVEGLPLPPGWSGKQHACAALARTARYPFLVFVDADVRLSDDAVARMARHMERHPELGLASGFPRQVTGTWSEILLLPLIHMLLLCYLPIPLAMMSRAPGLAAGCGQLFIARADAYAASGGHTAISRSRHDGIKLPRAFRRAGFATGLFDATALASCRMYATAAAVWEGLTKNATEGMATPVGLPIWTLLLGVGHVVPLPLALLDPTPFTIAAAATGFAIRLILAIRFRQHLASVVLHPLSVAALLAVQWASLLRAVRGQPSTWRGRSYPVA